MAEEKDIFKELLSILNDILHLELSSSMIQIREQLTRYLRITRFRRNNTGYFSFAELY